MVRVGVLAALAVACGSNATDGAGTRTELTERAHGAVVATVNEAQIGVDDVAEVVRETGLTPREALERLVAEQLLGRRAERRGYGAGPAMDRELKKARARALLEATIEREITPASIPEREVEARFHSLKASLAQKNMRRVSRLVWPRPPSEAADATGRALAEAALQRLSALPFEALREELLAIQAEAREHGGNLPFEDKDVVLGAKGLDAAYARALETMTKPGLVPHVVETRRAYFVVVVNEVIFAREAALAEHEEKLRETLANERRAARLDELLAELAERTTVTYDEQAIARALADDSLLGSLP